MKPGDDMPAAEIGECEDGGLWYNVTDYMHPDSAWIHLGIAPRPRTTWEVILYHIGNGLVMQYPLLSILSFAWQNRRAFIDKPVVVDALDPEP